MTKHYVQPLRRVFKAFYYSIDGLKACYRSEQAFRQELWLVAALLILSFFYNLTAVEYAVIIFSLFLVLIAELLNSGIEAIVDWISEEKHELAKKAKDVGSAAVFLALINLMIVWVLVVIF